MAIEIFQESSIPQGSLTPAMKFLLTKWTTLSAMNQLSLQALTDSPTYDIRNNGTYMIGAGDDFFFMHVGEKVKAAIGTDFTGRMLSSINDPVAVDLIDAYRQAVEQQAPIFLRFTSSVHHDALLWERLVLPVPVERLGIILVCFSEVLGKQQDVYQHLFRQARYPYIIVYPILTAEGAFDDGWILLMNAAAEQAFNITIPIRNLRMREMPLFQFGQVWALLRDKLPMTQPRVSVGFDRLEIDLIKVDHLLAIRFGAGIAAAEAAA
jgi:hypothetical protein